jgi:hypothetical protein
VSERSHVHPVFLPVELYIGISKVQAKLEIGKSAAILDMINEGLFNGGFISETVYAELKRKYERKLLEIVKKKKQEPITHEQMIEQQELKKQEKLFSEVIEQWTLHPSLKWRNNWAKEAEKWKDKIPNAKIILALPKTETDVNSVVRGNDSMESLKTEGES